MHTHPISLDVDLGFVLVRAFRSLRVGEAEVISEVVDAFGGAWLVQTGDDYDGYLFILIEPSAEDTQLPTYMVSGKTGQIELAAIDGDCCKTISRFDSVDGLAAVLKARLAGVST